MLGSAVSGCLLPSGAGSVDCTERSWRTGLPAVLLLGVVAPLLVGVLWGVATTVVGQFGRARELEQGLRAVEDDRFHRLAELVGVPVRVVDADAALALTVGVLRPRVLVTRRLLDQLDEAEVQAVLVHERSHLRRRDPLTYGLARGLAQVGALVPGLRVQAERVVLAAEVAADAAAVEACGRAPLVRALHRLTEGNDLLLGDAAYGSVRGMLEPRLLALQGEPWMPTSDPHGRVLTLVGVVLLAAPLLTLLLLR